MTFMCRSQSCLRLSDEVCRPNKEVANPTNHCSRDNEIPGPLYIYHKTIYIHDSINLCLLKKKYLSSKLGFEPRYSSGLLGYFYH